MSTRSVRYSTFNRSIRKGNLASTDRDALAFLEAAQIYNANQQRAIVNLVRSLKRVGLWSKMKAIYPFVGGTASSHKWNLKDPRDVDAAFRLTFSGGWTHSSTGADPNGTNAYADTYLNPNTTLTNANNHASYYSRDTTTNTNGYYDFGASDNTDSANNNLALALKRPIFLTSLFDSGNSNTSRASTTSVTNSLGYFIGSCTSSSSRKLYVNNTSVATNTTSDTTALPNTSAYFAAIHDKATNVAQYYCNREIAFATIGDGLTDNDATNLYNIVDLYQKRLGRAV